MSRAVPSVIILRRFPHQMESHVEPKEQARSHRIGTILNEGLNYQFNSHTIRCSNHNHYCF
jgi:hypothetical protein